MLKTSQELLPATPHPCRCVREPGRLSAPLSLKKGPRPELHLLDETDLGVATPPHCICICRGYGDISFAGCHLPLLTHRRLPVN